MSDSNTCLDRGVRRPRFRRALAAGCAPRCSRPPAELEAERALSQYVRDRWATETGFPGGPVYAITQTGDGYLWIGAEKGLVRFDGLTFRLFEPKGGDGQCRSDGPRCRHRSRRQPLGTAARHCPRAPSQRRISEHSHRRGRTRSVVSAMQRGRDDTMLLATLDRGAVIYRGGRFERLAPEGAVQRRRS